MLEELETLLRIDRSFTFLSKPPAQTPPNLVRPVQLVETIFGIYLQLIDHKSAVFPIHFTP
ncbi:hypothetical protein AN958_09366 [Leucoagaricus sp. SymC.cos]|nr:hypothetical protein AN958_09366 [Leucoagaricus sp. SymC.cos]